MTDRLSAGALRVPRRALALVVVVAVLGYGLMLGHADREVLQQTMRQLPEALLWQVAGLALCSYLLRFCRWQYFLGALAWPVAWWRSLEIYLGAFALTLSPGKLGELVRSLYLLPLGVPLHASLAAFLAERLLDVLAVALLACLGGLLFVQFQVALGVLLGLLGGVLWGCTRGLPVPLLQALLRRLARRVPVWPVRLPFLLSGWRLLVGTALALLAWSAQGLALAWLVEGFGYALSPWLLMGIYCLSLLAGAASLLPGGIGVTEASMTGLLVLAGLVYEDALLAALICRGLTLWLALLVGLLAMARLACTRSATVLS